ncbi:T9SS type A sorting domain-containing protein [Candidatus Zixiibacteriota bacterium]
MNVRKLVQWTLNVTVIALLLNGYSSIDAQPTNGDWEVPTDFGEFVFTVNPAGTYIIKNTYNFSDWTCGSVTFSGTISIQSQPGWPITDYQFTIQNYFDPSRNEKMTINGAFSETEDVASGTWSADIYGTICSGTWDGSHIPNVSVEEPCLVDGTVPQTCALNQNYPNPFNPNTKIKYQLPQDGYVTLSICNLLGQEIVTLVDADLATGSYSATWNGRDSQGVDVSAGIYFCTMKAGEFTQTRKMVLLR